ncbi:hypothetical protein EDD11_009470 [Mortierella claussenii]|nr:hypothetical protein EDD11_009470 [Mortierella claussenii]
MTNVGDSGQHSQAFRLRSSSSHATLLRVIPARQDSKTSEYIILWSDIQNNFAGAERIVNGDCAVLFMTDENFEYLKPKRIPYHPGVVLDVVMPGVSHVTNPVHTAEVADPLLESRDTTLAVMRHGSAAIAASESQVTIHSPTLRRDSDMQAIIDGQEHQTEDIKNSVRYYYDKLQAEVERSRVLQERHFVMQKQMHELQLAAEEDSRRWQKRILDQQRALQRTFEERQDKMKKMQEEALERLAIVQNKVQAVLTQTYELHEFPIPHLFIVLPKATRMRDSFAKPFSNQFRLFFLCECGKHTMTEGSKIPHVMHLAKHEGYDIDRPTEFFQQYGPYVLTMMQMVKFGFSVAGVVVPALANTGLIEGINAVQDSLDLAQNRIGSLVDDTINFINDQFSNADGGIEMVREQGNQNGLDKLEALEGADLRQLESYLSVNDKGRVLGNLYRISTKDGKVKWVCIDHYRENYRVTAMQNLMDAIKANAGLFQEEHANIIIAISSSTQAKQFYDVLVKSRGVLGLDVTLGWDATLDDFRKLASVVSTANIAHLKLAGTSFKGSRWDLLNNGRRFDPIVQLLQDQRIQTMELIGFTDFYAHVSVSSLGMAPQLRKLVLGSDFDTKDKEACSVMVKILKSCRSLANLTVHAVHLSDAFNYFMANMKYYPTLDTLNIQHMQSTVSVKLLRGKVLGASMSTLVELATTITQEQSFLECGLLTRLAPKRSGDEIDEGVWYSFLTMNPKVSEIEIACHGGQAFPLSVALTSVRARIMAEKGFSALRLLELHSGGTLFASISFTAEASQSITSPAPFAFRDLDTSKFLTFGESDGLSDLLREHGSTIERLTIDEQFKEHHAVLLDTITSEHGSNLKAVRMYHEKLTPISCDSLDRVIDRSVHLKRFELRCNHLSTDEQKALAERLILRHRTRLNDLTLTCPDTKALATLTKAIPSRQHVPLLDTLSLDTGLQKAEYRPEVLEWVKKMVSSPPQPLQPSTMPPPKANTTVSDNLLQAPQELTVTWTPLMNFNIQGIFLDPEQWETLIKALDFSFLEELGVGGTNFDMEQLQLLTDELPEPKKRLLPLRRLKLGGTKFVRRETRKLGVPRGALTALRKKAPVVNLVP